MSKYKKPAEDSYASNREFLKKNSPWVCELCTHKIKKKHLTVDHIIPLSRGGTNELVNLRLLHSKCNEIKGNKLDSEFNWIIKLYFGFFKFLRIFYP